jgi:hypothetical protein
VGKRETRRVFRYPSGLKRLDLRLVEVLAIDVQFK